jgi:predicted aldo/keto reductase-like oxidoreductase
MKRRTFLAGMGTAVGAGAMGNAAEVASALKAGDMPRRLLGKTGRSLPVVGFPCLALKNGDQQAATEALHRAMDVGVDYFDVAPAYGKEGECEIKTGEGLKGIARDKYFLACKTQKDDAKEGRLELERSLKRLNTDHFDLYQLHCLQREDEVKQALGPGGVLEMILKAKEEGKVKHIGFSAHTTEAALAALDGFDFDSCMFPINFVEWYQTGFGREVMERAAAKGTAMISIKPVSRGLWPKEVKKTYDWWYRPLEDPKEYQLAMDWVLSLPGMVTTLPTSYYDVFDRTVEAARKHQPIGDDDKKTIQEIATNCLPIFKNGEKKSAAQFILPGIPSYPSRPYRV